MKRRIPRPSLERLEDRIALNAGDLDRSFGGDGIATFHFNWSDSGRAMVVQPDGKIVVGGGTSGPGGARDFALVRFNRNGSVDTSFGTAGVVQTDFDGRLDTVGGLALQPDGKIIAAGGSIGAGSRVALARYHPDGSLDQSFGTGGRVVTDPAAGDDNAMAVALQPDGKIVIVGNTQPSPTASHSRFLAARYHPDGSLDSTFGQGGTTSTDFGVTDAVAWSLALQPDGKIVAAGYPSSSGGNFGVAVARYNADGSPDSTFDDDGKLTTDFPEGEREAARDVLLQPDGKILVVGNLQAQQGAGSDILLARYNPDGSADDALGGDGQVVVELPGSFDVGNGVALQPDGKIVVAGGRGAGGPSASLVARLNPDGSLDPSFGSPPNVLVSGIVLTDVIAGDNDGFADVGVVGNHILAVGTAGGGSIQNFLVARYRWEVVSGVSLRGRVLRVVGSDADDVVSIKRLRDRGIKVTTSFAPPRTFKPAAVRRIDVRLFGGNDRATVAVGVRQPAVLDGGAGDDRLLAGRGSSLLVGAGGTDILRGRAGRDFLVAGEGPGTLRGGGGDDLLLAGRTPLEIDRAALNAVLAEWRSERPYLTRVANLSGTGSGPAFDARLNGDHFLRPGGAGATVFAPGGVQDVRGGAGRDWFLVDLNGAPPALLDDVADNEALLELD